MHPAIDDVRMSSLADLAGETLSAVIGTLAGGVITPLEAELYERLASRRVDLTNCQWCCGAPDNWQQGRGSWWGTRAVVNLGLETRTKRLSLSQVASGIRFLPGAVPVVRTKTYGAPVGASAASTRGPTTPPGPWSALPGAPGGGLGFAGPRRSAPGVPGGGLHLPRGADAPRGHPVASRGGGLAGGSAVNWVAAAAGAAVLLPFLQAVAAQAGNKAFEFARERIQKLITQRRPGLAARRCEFEGKPSIVITEEATETVFALPADLPDEALEALAQTDLESLVSGRKDGQPRPCIVWDGTAWVALPPKYLVDDEDPWQ